MLRSLDDCDEDPTLAKLEDRLYEKLTPWGIGLMGFGGKTSVSVGQDGLCPQAPGLVLRLDGLVLPG